jgi:hypothetical protein
LGQDIPDVPSPAVESIRPFVHLISMPRLTRTWPWWLLYYIDLDVPIRLARAGAELETVANFALDLLDCFVAGEGFDFDMAYVAAVVLCGPAAREHG